jgi:hypothetical protein
VQGSQYQMLTLSRVSYQNTLIGPLVLVKTVQVLLFGDAVNEQDEEQRKGCRSHRLLSERSIALHRLVQGVLWADQTELDNLYC